MTMLEAGSSRDVVPTWFDLMSSELMNTSKVASNSVLKVLEHLLLLLHKCPKTLCLQRWKVNVADFPDRADASSSRQAKSCTSIVNARTFFFW